MSLMYTSALISFVLCCLDALFAPPSNPGSLTLSRQLSSTTVGSLPNSKPIWFCTIPMTVAALNLTATADVDLRIDALLYR